MKITATAVLTDIEGTTTPITFVKDVLFPYARSHVREFLEAKQDQPNVAMILAEMATLAKTDTKDPNIIRCLQQWMDKDRKVGPLKALQGLIWEEGYKTGRLKGAVYDDAVKALRDWSRRGFRLAVYSSGSVLAQKLLFGSTAAGDLSLLFEAFFDTAIGAKRETQAYRAIAAALRIGPPEVLFLSDVVEELDAAAAAGLKTVQVVREADGTIASERHPYVRSFAEIDVSKQMRSEV